MVLRRPVSVIIGLALAISLSSAPAEARSNGVTYHGPRTSKVIALTFDDGWSPKNCRKIFATLQAKHVKATFFPYSAAMGADKAFWKMVSDRGYPIGSHTRTHPFMPGLSYAKQLAQIRDSRRQTERIIGRPMLDVFRPPYGATNANTIKAAHAAGFATILNWDVTDDDTSRHATIKSEIRAAERGTKGSVVLMHCGPSSTPSVVGPVIDYYRDRGYTFVTVPELLGLRYDGPPIRFGASAFGSRAARPD